MGTDGPAHATSRDGTEIAYRWSGDGPPLLCVHGTTADHTRWAPLLPHLEPHATVYTIDRRGRGGSGDAPDYHVEREFEDVAAAVDTIAEQRGEKVDVYGHSYGALCALGGATLSANVRRLVLYEPVVTGAREHFPEGLTERMEDELARGNPERVVELLFTELLGMSPDEVSAFKAAPSWTGRVAAAGTVPRETRTELGFAFEALQTSRVTAPTLMIKGERSPAWLREDTDRVAAALPDAQVIEIEGQEHVADVLVPDVFAARVVAFLRD